MVFMHRRIDRKNISGPGREVSVKLLAVTQMIDKLLRLLPDGDTVPGEIPMSLSMPTCA